MSKVRPTVVESIHKQFDDGDAKVLSNVSGSLSGLRFIC